MKIHGKQIMRASIPLDRIASAYSSAPMAVWSVATTTALELAATTAWSEVPKNVNGTAFLLPGGWLGEDFESLSHLFFAECQRTAGTSTVHFRLRDRTNSETLMEMSGGGASRVFINDFTLAHVPANSALIVWEYKTGDLATTYDTWGAGWYAQ